MRVESRTVRYRKVDPRVWGDAKFRTLPLPAKLMFLCVLTHPGMTSLGAFRGTPGGIAEELGWSSVPDEAVREFHRLVELGMVGWDPDGPLLWLPNWFRYNPPSSPNHVWQWGRVVDLLPECPGRAEVFRAAVASLEGLRPTFRARLPAAMREAEAEEVPEEPDPEKAQPRRRRGAVKNGAWSIDGKQRWLEAAGRFVPAEEWSG